MASDTEGRKVRQSHLRWVRVDDLQTPDLAKRDINEAWARRLADQFDLEAMGYPVVNHRDGGYFTIDGNHRVAALRILGFGSDRIQVECYEGMSEREEAKEFLRRNDRLTVRALDKFVNAIHAGYPDESEIDRVVRAQGLHIGPYGAGNLQCVEVLRKAFKRQGTLGLGKTLRVARDAYGDVGLIGPVIDGISLALHRYDGQIEERALVDALSRANGGLGGLLAQANVTKRQLAKPMSHCIAATIAGIYSRPRGRKLASWWAA